MKGSSAVQLFIMFTILLQENLSLNRDRNLPKILPGKLKIHRSSRLRSVRYLHANRKKVFVQNVTDVTLQLAEWFRKVKLSVLLLHRVSVNREHSLHFVHSTLEVLLQTLLPNRALIARYGGIAEIEEIRTVPKKDLEKGNIDIVIGRLAELRIIDKKTGIALTTHTIPYGSKLYIKPGQEIEKGKLICEWDPFNAVIISEMAGKIGYDFLIEGITFREESDEQTGFKEKVIIESRDKTKNPAIKILTPKVKSSGFITFLSDHTLLLILIQMVEAGEVLAKIPRAVGKSGDITGGLPRVTELFEARNPSNPAIVSEIDGEVTFGKIKRGNREITIKSKTDEMKKYLVPLSKQILVQENDYVRAGIPLSDGAITPSDILAIKGPTKVQEYIVNEIQEVYRLQGVKINDKHFEIIVRQMMRKVEIVDPGDTKFLESQVVDKLEFMDENDWIYGKKVIIDSGDSQKLRPGMIITARKLRDENSFSSAATLRLLMQGMLFLQLQARFFRVLQGLHCRPTVSSRQRHSRRQPKFLTKPQYLAKLTDLKGLRKTSLLVILFLQVPDNASITGIIVGSLEEYENLVGVELETAARTKKQI